MIPGFGAKFCKENYKGDNCDKCIDNFYGFPYCKGKFIVPGFVP